jgi:PQQ-like domain
VNFPGGVVDGGAAYVAEAGGIVAVELADGRMLWRSAAARRPLAVAGDRLVAEHAHRLVVLDAATGEVVAASDEVAEWKDAEVKLGARAEGGQAVVDWHARSRYRGGAPPPPHVLAREQSETRGALALDLATGALAPADPAPATPAPQLDWAMDGGEQTLSLGGTVLARGRGLVAEVTPDQQHVFVADGDRWRVFDAHRGRPQATLTHEPGAHAPAVLGSRAYYRVPGELVARDLATDAVAWRLPLEETPPRAAPRLRQ